VSYSNLLSGLIIMIALVVNNFGVGAFLDTSFNPKASAMGQSFVSLAKGSDAILWNPSRLESNFSEIKFSTFHSFETNFYSIQSQLANLAIPLGIQWVRSQIGDFKSTEKNETTGRYEFTGSNFEYVGDALFLASSMMINEIKVGIAGKFVSEKAGDFTTSGTGIDVGFSKNIGSEIYFGGSIKNIWSSEFGSSISNRTSVLARIIRVGGHYLILGGHVLSVDIVAKENRDMGLNLGGQYVVQEGVSIRGGFSDGQWSFGTGLVLDAVDVDTSVSFNPEYVGNVYRVSIGYRY
jgi:hypothetical protein